MIGERFRTVCAEFPDAVAVVAGDERITYQQLAARQAWFRRHLAGPLGVGEGDLVAACLSNRWEFIAAFLAAADLGAIFMPFNTNWRVEELRWFAERLCPSAVITDNAHREPWDRLDARIPHERVVVVDSPEVRTAFDGDSPVAGGSFGDHPALYLLTSGSTGRPRVVPRTHRMLLAGARNVSRALGVSAGQRFLSVVPFHHANGFANSMFLPLMNGATVVLMDRFVPAKLIEMVERERIQVLIGSPFIFSLLAEQEIPPGALASLEISLSSGAPMSAALKVRCRERLGIHVRQLYGSSETGTISIEPAGSAPLEGSVGVPVPEVEVRILDGEIAVRGPTTMPGYVAEPELNQELFRDGFFRTGDLGELDERNNLRICGRVKRMINVGGIKVDPVEIENVLLMLPAVRQCRVQGMTDHRETEIIKAEVAPDPRQPVSRAQIVEHCRGHLAEYKIPRIIEFVGGITVDLAGKSPATWREEK